ncbi:protein INAPERTURATE POLLEN1 [Diospyros lotus]|uniref:protein INAPERTURATE POLLEN1 n=1 Tax=Diospyros lotus TaxID=55363 RepID=UPI0022500C32|nr:protein INAPERTURATE POLLEN1 [Diospyros lotus]
MFKAVSLFSRKKTPRRPFKDFYAEWIDTLKNTLLPPLRRSMSWSASPSAYLLPAYVDMIHRHLQSYYDALDVAASDDVAQLLFPDWRNSLEKPFLWLGDLHPCLFTNLVRSFLESKDSDVDVAEPSHLFDKPWEIVMAWKNPTEALIKRIDEIERGLRLMVPALVARGRAAQALLAGRVGAEWGRCEGRKEAAKAAVGEAVKAEMEEMASVFVDANRVRRSVLADIVSATSIYQAALFLEGLSQFLVGFRDRELLAEFERCKTPLNWSSNSTGTGF